MALDEISTAVERLKDPFYVRLFGEDLRLLVANLILVRLNEQDDVLALARHLPMALVIDCCPCSGGD